MKKVTIYTDGACKGNPGPGGWGTVLSVEINHKIHTKQLSGGQANTTNNRMELTAVIEGINALTQTCEVHIYLDSQYVKQGINEWLAKWKANNWKTATNKEIKNIDLWQQLDKLVNNNPFKHQFHWHWVKGHAGDPGNELADKLANQGAMPFLTINNPAKQYNT